MEVCHCWMCTVGIAGLGVRRIRVCSQFAVECHY